MPWPGTYVNSSLLAPPCERACLVECYYLKSGPPRERCLPPARVSDLSAPEAGHSHGHGQRQFIKATWNDQKASPDFSCLDSEQYAHLFCRATGAREDMLACIYGRVKVSSLASTTSQGANLVHAQAFLWPIGLDTLSTFVGLVRG
jgi:hypothetical protein